MAAPPNAVHAFMDPQQARQKGSRGQSSGKPREPRAAPTRMLTAAAAAAPIARGVAVDAGGWQDAGLTNCEPAAV